MKFKSTITNGVGYAAMVVAVLTLFSRLVGLLRIRIFASQFGAGETLDVYYAAFRIPDFLMGVLIVGTLSIAALPVITQYIVKEKDAGRAVVANVLNLVVLAVGVLCGFAAIFAPQLVRLVAPGFGSEASGHVVELTRIILSAQIILAASNVLNTSLNAVKRFFWAGMAPIFYNVGLIAGVLWLYPHYGLRGLGYGVVLGAVLHLLVQLPEWLHAGFRFLPILKLDAPARAILKLYVPRLLTLDLSQVSLLLASIFGSYLAVGSIAVYTFGFDIQAMPVGVFAFAIATAAFPHLSEQFAKKDDKGFIVLLRQSVVRILFYLLPISVVLLLLRAQIVRILYGAGEFSWDDTRATFTVLGILAFSLIGQSLIPLLSRALLARHNTWAPVVSNIYSIIVTVCTSILLVPKYGIGGVAWGYVVGMTFNALLSYAWLRAIIVCEMGTEEPQKAEDKVLVREVSKIVISTIVFATALYTALYFVAPVIDTHTWLGLVLQSTISVGFAGLCYLLITSLFKLPDALSLIRLVYKKNV